MPRKSSKSTSTSKKFTTIPPKTKPIAEKAVASSAVAEAVSPVTPGVVAAPAVTQDIAPLLASLHSLDADTACEAATALGKTGSSNAVEPLIEIVRNTNGYFHSVVRSAAATSLGQLKDRRAVEALLEAVNDRIADPSTEAIHALTALADPRAIAKLVEVVQNPDGFFAGSVRRAAVLGLVKLGGDRASSQLSLTAANEQEDAVIRSEAAAAVKSH